MPYDVASPGNARVQRLSGLRNRRNRDREGVFVVEEPRVLDRAIGTGHQPSELYWCPDLCGLPVGFESQPVTLTIEAANRASYRTSSTGLIGVFPFFETALVNLKLPRTPLLLVAEGLEKPGNLGALLRIADAAGADGVVVVDPSADPFNPNVVRASTGALFTVPLGVVDEVSDVEPWLREHGISSVAAAPEAETTMWEADLTGARAVWVGSEADGLSPEARRLAAIEVSIPMAGVVDSLNASVSAAILVYESIRQRLR